MMHFRVIDRAEAQADPLGAVMITGDCGGFTYLICKASRVNATDRVLDQLASISTPYSAIGITRPRQQSDG